jgi:hypothetical protein
MLIEVFRGFIQSHQVNPGLLHQIRPRPLPSTSFSIHYSLTILSFGAIKSE